MFGDLESGHQHGSGFGTAISRSEASTKPVQDAIHQAMAVLGIAVVAGGKEIGAQMAMRSFSHLVRRLLLIDFDLSPKPSIYCTNKSQ